MIDVLLAHRVDICCHQRRSYTRAFRFKCPDSQMPLLAGTTVVLGKATFEVACRTS